MAELVTLANDHAQVVVSPAAGASLRSLRARNARGSFELLAGGEGPHDPERLPSGVASFVMAPWVNRILDGRLITETGDVHELPVGAGSRHAIHGTVRRARWEVVEQQADALECSTPLSAPWPWAGRIVQRIALRDNALWQEMRVESQSERFPAALGWHPYFRRHLASRSQGPWVRAGVRDEWELDADMTPTGKRQRNRNVERLCSGDHFEAGELDCCYSREAGSQAELRWPELDLTIEMSETLSHLMVYTPQDAVCVEPQSSTVNANQLAAAGVPGTGVRYVEPGAPLIAETLWRWS